MEEKSIRKRVTFKIHAPDASNVFLAGDFNDWDTGSLPLRQGKKNGDGLWRLAVYLEPGRHQYRFIVDGLWCDDPLCPQTSANEFGTNNAVLDLPGDSHKATGKKPQQKKSKK